MSRIQSFVTLLTLLSAVVAGAAHAVQRTHVSAAFGADANTATNCTAVAPCRFFQAAMTVTDSHGEVVALDSGGYGAVNITQSVALIAPTGVYAGISVFPGATGVTIATAGVDVVLRGLTINSQGGNGGVSMTAGSSLSVENCVITNFTGGTGVYVATPATVGVRDTVLRNNFYGVFLDAGAAATIARTSVATAVGTGAGIYVNNGSAGTTTSAAITDTTLSGGGGGGIGIFAISVATSANVRTSVVRSTVTRYNTGIGAQQTSATTGSAIMTVSETMVNNNANGLYELGGVLRSLGNNTVDQNNLNKVGTISIVAPI